MNNLQFLIDKYTEKVAELETQILDIKRKLNIVTEASRLLEEEGLLEESPCVVRDYNP